jgi:hypothetical protein
MPTNVDGERAERSARFPQCKAANLVACSFEPRKKDLMISKIISSAACLRELATNPKSFSNCPDLHGGVPDFPEDRICMKPALGENTSARRQFPVLVP